MSTLTGIREALATNLSTVARAYPYPLSNPTAPGFEVDLDTTDGVEYDHAMGHGLNEWHLVVRGFVSENSDVVSQKHRDGWLDDSGATSVKTAIESDKTLAGSADTVHVTHAVPRQLAHPSNPNATYVGAEWFVRVLAVGT